MVEEEHYFQSPLEYIVCKFEDLFFKLMGLLGLMIQICSPSFYFSEQLNEGAIT
jgi:hypothetical protein